MFSGVSQGVCPLTGVASSDVATPWVRASGELRRGSVYPTEQHGVTRPRFGLLRRGLLERCFARTGAPRSCPLLQEARQQMSWDDGTATVARIGWPPDPSRLAAPATV